MNKFKCLTVCALLSLSACADECEKACIAKSGTSMIESYQNGNECICTATHFDPGVGAFLKVPIRVKLRQ